MKNAHWLLACVLLLTGCFPYLVPPPGFGLTYMARKEEAKPVIAALASYHEAKQSYPADLKELVPGYLKSTPDQIHISYAMEGASYTLRFDYVNVCMNNCTYTPQAGKWTCSGYC